MRIKSSIAHVFLLSICIVVNATVTAGSVDVPTVGWFKFIADRLLSIWSPQTTDFEFWKEAKSLERGVTKYVNDQLNLEALKDASIATQIDNFKTAMQHVLNAAQELRPMDPHSVLEKRDGDLEYTFDVEDFEVNQTLDEFIRNLNVGVDNAIKRIQVEFSEPLPENRTERYKSREVAVDYALHLIEDVYVKACKLDNISEEQARVKFGGVRHHIRHVVLIMGKITDDHPYLADILIFSAAVFILPEFFVLRPIIRLFGISPIGPVKGSAAAWCQRFFFGGAVSKGSWFARLTQAGMKSPMGWFSKLMSFLFG
ncbi:hypothetical protein HYPSUDRAFT_33514 [Hypholoma sublateritium FD-334 SS-4]|uniref:Uncharacterized protein n=1 Tax=Hypholoma sublateritium (strain FD-334 SS-4) TaxID=945553 RepID=A0A0D2LM12_HYPSF|nr:hypothetical protein HYPSUDRAFT_33514 [Hypholoma sublateritium FD-334 SS-4]